jgi:hypothetical protein
MAKNDDIVGLEGYDKVLAVPSNRYLSLGLLWWGRADCVADH